MQNFLEKFKDYTGDSYDLIFFAFQLKINQGCELSDDLLDKYDEMNKLLDRELVEQGDGDNPMYDNDNEHELCCNELI